MDITRLSLSGAGDQANNESYSPQISGNGRYVAFHSLASNLVSGDTNARYDVFVKDLVTGAIERVSTSETGVEGNENSMNPSISADGRYVAFQSFAWNLTLTGGPEWDIFVKDRLTGGIERVSASAYNSVGGYAQFPSISADGRYVAFEAGSALVEGDVAWMDIYVADRFTGQVARASSASNGEGGNNHSYRPTISADGMCVAFSSAATNLVSGDTSAQYDIFLWNRGTALVERVNVSSSGEEANHVSGAVISMSADGRFVGFQSNASNLVPGVVYMWHVYVRDRQLGTTELISKATDGTPGDWYSGYPSLSADGRYVAFESQANNLAPGDAGWDQADVFLVDRQTGTIQYVNVSSQTEAQWSGQPSISATGRLVAFASQAQFLVPNDTNSQPDIFARDMGFSFALTIQDGLTQVVGGNSFVGEVTLNGPAPAGGVSVTLSDNSAFATTPATVMVLAGESSATFEVTTKGVDSNTNVIVTATAGGLSRQRTVTIKPAGLTLVSLTPSTVYGGSSMVVKAKVQLNGKVGPTPIVISLSSSDSIASLPATVTLETGRTQAEVVVSHNALSLRRTANISATYGGVTKKAPLLVLPMILKSLELNMAVLTGGVSQSLFATVTLPEALPISVDVALSSSHSDIVAVPSSVRVLAGNTTATIRLTHFSTPSEKLVTISGVLGTFTRTDTITIRVSGLKSLLLNPTVVAGGGSSTGTVTLNAPAAAGGATITLGSNSGSATVPGSVFVPAGATQATFTVATSAVGATTYATITGTLDGVVRSRVLKITP